MSQINFACPQCNGSISKQINSIPDDAVINAACPHCMLEFELMLDETTVQILNIEELLRLWK